jgi:mRNA-degrading endonuclease RelE of RelBE toxin-antitoxin system
LTKILVRAKIDLSWRESSLLRTSVIDDLRWFGRKDGRLLLDAAEQRLAHDPTAEDRNLKTLRTNPVAQRELRLFGKYRVLFNVDTESETVTVVLVGEKRGDALIVRGEEFRGHHEDHPPE